MEVGNVYEILIYKMIVDLATILCYSFSREKSVCKCTGTPLETVRKM